MVPFTQDWRRDVLIQSNFDSGFNNHFILQTSPLSRIYITGKSLENVWMMCRKNLMSVDDVVFHVRFIKTIISIGSLDLEQNENVLPKTWFFFKHAWRIFSREIARFEIHFSQVLWKLQIWHFVFRTSLPSSFSFSVHGHRLIFGVSIKKISISKYLTRIK